MKLTNDEINQMAAELLGIEWQKYDNYGIRNPDFIHDANAVRELVVWFVENGTTAELCSFDNFLEDEDGADVFSKLYALALPPRTITLAVLYAAGKITEQQAKEAMSDE